MSNKEQGGMSGEQKKAIIVAGLEDVTPDVIDLLYRILLHAQSGLE